MPKIRSVLFITTRLPEREDRGDSLRVLRIAALLKRHWALDLVSLTDRSDPEMDLISGLFRSIKVFKLRKLHSAIAAVCSLFTKQPAQVAYFKNAACKKYIELVADNYNLIIVHLVRGAVLLPQNRDLPVILEMTDSISTAYESFAGIDTNDFRRLLYNVEATKMRRYENLLISRYRNCVVVSKRDDVYASPLNIIGNGVDLLNVGYPDLPTLGCSPVNLLFIGACTSMMNRDALKYFVDDIVPILKKHNINFKLSVIGAYDKRVERIVRSYTDFITLHGFQSSMVSIARSSHIGVAPIRMAAGQQNKILDYMGMNLPVISSSLAVAGYELTSEHVLIADDPAEFVEAVIRICTDHDYASMLRKNSKSWLVANHSWEKSLGPYVALAEKASGNRSNR